MQNFNLTEYQKEVYYKGIKLLSNISSTVIVDCFCNQGDIKFYSEDLQSVKLSVNLVLPA